MNGSGDPRTVLLVLHGESVGGASLSILRAVPGLERRGWRFVAWAARPSPLFDELIARGIEAHGAPPPFGGYSLRALRVEPGAARRLARAPRYFGGLAKLIRKTRPAIVHANSLYATAEAGLARALRAPTVLHVHEMPPPGRKGRVARRLAHGASDVLIGASEACASALSVGAAHATVVYESVPVSSDPPPPRPRRDGTVVGTIGVISRRKGTDVFVEAARRVRAATDQVEFRIVGGFTDPLDREWGERVLRALPDGVSHEPAVDVPETLAGWDVFALPSRSDPFPIAMLEAMAAGLPVIGARVDGIREQITPEAGLLVEPDDPESLAEAVLDLHADPERRERLGHGGWSRVASSFPLEREVEGLDAAYRSAVSGG
jgi:glycosyltransferase involved in cell wall biosynthesis